MKTRLIFILIAIFGSFSAMAQREIAATDSFLVTGKIKNPKTFTLAELDAFPKSNLKDLIIHNHKGEIKDTLINMKGVALKTVLSSIEYVYEKPKNLNEFYFIFIATDGYKVTFSWNEIYNTEAGNNFFIVTGMNGKKLKELDQRIFFISSSDIKTGRRYIKGLSKIEVKQVD